MSDKAVFILNYLGLHDEEGNKIYVRDPLTTFHSFMMKVPPNQADPNYKYIRMTCRVCIQITLDVDGIYDIIDTYMLKRKTF